MKNIFVLLITALVTFSCVSQSNKQILPDAYLKESNQTRDFLKRSFSSIPEGAAFKTPVDEIKVFDANRPGDDLIASAEEHKSWNSHSYYHFVLDLSDMKLVSYTQNASYTTTASILLDYYFSGLADLGYKTAGELHTMIFYPAQFASSTWFNQFCNIVITGSVYINVEYKTAMVSVDISEIY